VADETETHEEEEPTPSRGVPLVLLELQGVDLDVAALPGGGKALVIGPFLMKLALPLDEENAAAVARELTGAKVLVAPAAALQGLRG
jgi:hypothetical protein